MKIAGFDLEIHDEIKSGEDWTNLLPLGITCAAVNYGGKTESWRGSKFHGKGGDRMLEGDLVNMLVFLQNLEKDGWTIFTWNGLQFDFRVLLEEFRRVGHGFAEATADMALRHVDMMFHFFCIKGFPLSLAKVAAGLGVGGKTEGMSGALAPVLWTADKYELAARDLEEWIDVDLDVRRRKIVEYVKQDAKITTRVGEMALIDGGWTWTSNSGRPQKFLLADWINVKEAIKLPDPAQSWMNDPILKESFYEWMPSEWLKVRIKT